MVNDILDGMVRIIDVLQRAMPQSRGAGVGLTLNDVLVRAVQQFQCVVEPTDVVPSRVRLGMIVQILAVIDGGPLDFINRPINLVYGVLIMRTGILALQEKSGHAQVA